MMASSRRVLVVDDDTAMREMILALLKDEGLQVTSADGAAQALESARDAEFDAILSDVRVPGWNGTEFLAELREVHPDTPVVLMTALGSVDSAIEAMRAGAFDYITKPFKRDAVIPILERAFEHRALEQENRRLRRAVDELAFLRSASVSEESLEDPVLKLAVERRLTLRELSDRYIDRILKLTGGNKVQAAKILGINRRTLYRRSEHHQSGIKSHGVH